MPFRLKMSQDVFQMPMDQITNRHPGIIAIHGDICVYGKDTTEHCNIVKLAQLPRNRFGTHRLYAQRIVSKHGLMRNTT